MKDFKYNTFVGDIETDGLLDSVSKVWCIVNYDLTTEAYHISVPAEYWGSYLADRINYSGHGPRLPIPKGSKVHMSHEDHLIEMGRVKNLVYHNGISFDEEVIKKLYPESNVRMGTDTLILSQLFRSDRSIPLGCKSGHSIEAWGKRFGVPKPPYEDWSKFSWEMLHRCIEDVKIGTFTYKYLIQEASDHDWTKAIALEEKIARIHNKQVERGVKLNRTKAENLYQHFTDKIAESDLYTKPLLPKRIVKFNANPTVKKPFKMDGSYSANCLSYFSEEGEADRVGVGGPFTRISYEDLKITSGGAVKDYLISVGWIPDEWNLKKLPDGKYIQMSPKLTQSSLERSKIDSKLGKLIIERMMLSHRKGKILSPKGGFLNDVRADGRVPAEAFTCGTPTGRYRHQRSICNLPRPSTIYGKELRELCTTDWLRSMVGVDLAGIEARMMVEYCLPFVGGEELYNLVIGADKTNDFHTMNAQLWDLPGTPEKARDTAKSGLYCLMYGGGAKKLADTLGKPPGQGAKLRKAFWDGNPSLKALKKAVETAYKRRGWLIGIDGRKLFIRQQHKLLNSLFQAGAAVVFKYWLVLIDEWLMKEGLDCFQIIAYHDEIQLDSDPWIADKVKSKIEELAKVAGKELGLAVPIEAEGKVGLNWADTH